MTLRQMSNVFRGFCFYRSTFDPLTGTLVREVNVPEHPRHWADSWSSKYDTPTLLHSLAESLGIKISNLYYDEGKSLSDSWARKFGSLRRNSKDDKPGEPRKYYCHTSDIRLIQAFSPVPETIDVKITDWCNFGCDYCYMDSTTKGKHAPKDLLIEIFNGLKSAPYQIAFGGGEPTAHPDFPWFLEYTRSKGTVPNYTTAGHILRDDVIEATNKYCGGVALTYHAFKGPEYFRNTYRKWRDRLDPRVQLNVHVLFDKDVADNLLDLQEVGLTDLNVVLLAYYPGVGRSTWEYVPSKGVAEVTLPAALKKVTEESKFRIAFSEGLLPYFLSHQLPEVNTTFAGQQEGLFSCYVDDQGRVSHSSFDPPSDDSWQPKSIYEKKFQKIWNTLNSGYSSRYEPCRPCNYRSQCNIPSDAHFLLCKFAEHNATMPDRIPERRRRLTVLQAPVSGESGEH